MNSPQTVKTQLSKDAPPSKALEELFDVPPKGVKLEQKVDELQEQIDKLQKQRDFLLSKGRAAAIEDINEKIVKFDISPKELAFVHPIFKQSAAAKSKVPVKYKLGNNAWSGRGRQPKWVVEHITKGGKIEDLLVK